MASVSDAEVVLDCDHSGITPRLVTVPCPVPAAPPPGPALPPRPPVEMQLFSKAGPRCGFQGKVAGGEEHSTRGSVLATNGKRVEGEPMKDMEKSPSNGKQETVNGQGKKRWVSNKRDGSATSRAAGRSRQNIFTIYQRWLCKLNPAINFLVLSLFITLTNLVRI